MTGARAKGQSEGPLRVAVLADDLTGAGDTAVQFAEAGWPAFLQRSSKAPALPDLAVVARAISTRAAPDDVATERTAEAVAAQLAAGVIRLYLKIDSTMRGSISAQLRGALRAWRARHPGAFVVLCPAYPEMGRTISDGRLWVNGEPLEQSPAGTDPVTPVRTSVMAELVPGAAVVAAAPPDRLRKAIESAAGRADVVVVEAQSSDHVRALADVVAAFGPLALPAGSAGLALPLAVAWKPDEDAIRPAPLPVVADRILVVLSSANEVSRRQVRASRDALGARMQISEIGREDVLDPARATAWAARLPVDPSVTVLAVSAPGERLTGIDLAETGARVAAGLSAAVQRLVDRERCGALVLLGGDGAEATLNRLGVEALRVIRRVIEGAPLSQAMVSDRAGLVVVTKAGGFGTDGTLLSILQTLRREKE